jgi:hypothetical protein
MLTWCAILFILGILAFLDAMIAPPYGDIFRKVNSIFFMLISLGMLIRLRMERSQHNEDSPVHKAKSPEKEETPVGVEN